MDKKVSLFPLVGLALLLLVLLAGFLINNMFSKPDQEIQSLALQQISSPTSEQVIATETGSAETVNPTATLSINPYPAPTDDIVFTPTEEPIVILPPLTPYPTPGPFNNMRMIYTQSDKPGYWIKSINGNDEQELTGWWSLPENATKFGTLRFKPSPVGEYLLFFSSDNTSIEIPEANSFWVNRLDGSQPLVFVKANENWYPENPAWSPDGQQIAYRRTYINKPESGDFVTGKGFEIWIMNMDGSSEKKIFSDPDMWVTSFGGELPLFRWLNNGYLYFALNDPSGPIYAVNSNDGTSYKLFDRVRSIQWRLSLSPDGQHVSQSSDVPADIIKKAGLIPVDVLPYKEKPKWSADGKKILYKAEDKNETDKVKIILQDLITKNTKEVMKLNEKDELLGFSPDDRFIAYKDETGALYVFDQITNVSTMVIQGEWQSQPNKVTVRFIDWLPVP